MSGLLPERTHDHIAKRIIRALTPEVIILLVVGIVVGILLFNDYGLSWDEYYNETYARHTVEMYLGARAPGDTVIDKKYYGPSFLVLWLLARDTLIRLFPVVSRTDAGHLVYWFAYLPAPVLFYGLCRRFAGRLASLAATLLFAAQPAIFGHAFVNPKDPPFMTAMLAAVWAGMNAVDLSAQSGKWLTLYAVPSEARRLLGMFESLWNETSRGRKTVVLVLWGALILLCVDLLITHRLFHWSLGTVQRAYDGQAVGPIQSLFDLIAQDAFKSPLSAYTEKLRVLYLWARFPLLLSACLLLFVFSIRILGSRISRRWFSYSRTVWTWIGAAVILGLCSAIRVLGPFAGALIALYALSRLKKRAWLPIIVYAVVSIAVLFAAWPSLWTSPFQIIYESLFRMSRFPWEGRIRYDGIVYAVDQLPWHYVPRSIVLELTIPALIASSLGLLFVLLTGIKHKRIPIQIALILLWFGLPLSVVVLMDVQIYSAFRHLMFILPGFFVLAAIGFERILSSWQKPLWASLLIAIAVAPGLIAIVNLHPYEIIYYNELVGGVSGAAGRFSGLDWGTPYREVIEYVSEVAPEGSRVLVDQREYHTMTPFLREDIKINRLSSENIRSASAGTYFINAGDLSSYFRTETVYVVERDGRILADVQVLP